MHYGGANLLVEKRHSRKAIKAKISPEVDILQKEVLLFKKTKYCIPLHIVAVAILISGSSLQAQNLVKNGDFTLGLANWTVKSDSPKNTAEVLQDAGGKSGKTVRITDGDEKVGISLVQKFPCESGKTYELSFMSRTTSDQKGAPGYAMIQFLDVNGSWLNNPDAPTLTPEKKS